MTISHELLEFWIERVAELDGLSMDADKLIEDVVMVAIAFNQDPDIFELAMTNTVEALKLIIRERTVGQELVGNKVGWTSFHFQSRKIRKLKADMRIVYRDVDKYIQVMGFGHRWLPQEIYDRLSSDRP